MTPFLLIPGLNANAHVFASAAEALWKHGPVTIANHIEGDGMAGITANILAEAPPRFALAGFSFGGYLAFEILRQAPDRVLKLALIDTSARSDTPESRENRERRITLVEEGRFPAVINQSFPGSVHPENANDADLMAAHAAMSRANGAEAYVRHQKAIIDRPDSRPLLGTIRVPTVVIVGEEDQITPLAVAREMHARINLSRLFIIPGAGHMALLEQPQAVNDALVDWAA